MKNRCFIFLLIMLLPSLTWAQTKNTATEVKDYREVEGKIILDLIVNGEQAGFVLDLAGHTAILPEYVEKFKIDPNTPGNFGYEGFLYKHVPTSKSVLISTMSFGNNVFGNGVSAFVLEDEPYMMLDMMTQISDPRIKLCLDIGHAHAMTSPDIPVERWIEVLGPHIAHFHLHNNDGSGDDHRPFGEGTMDMVNILKTIDNYCPEDATLTIEARQCLPCLQWLEEKSYI